MAPGGRAARLRLRQQPFTLIALGLPLPDMPLAPFLAELTRLDSPPPVLLVGEPDALAARPPAAGAERLAWPSDPATLLEAVARHATSRF